jgi:hypothetical protein
VNYDDASSNETTRFMKFDKGRWYAVRVRVTPKKIEAWLDQEQVVNLETTGKTLGLRSGPIEESVPLGIATYETTAHIRNITLKKLPDTP